MAARPLSLQPLKLAIMGLAGAAATSELRQRRIEDDGLNWRALGSDRARQTVFLTHAGPVLGAAEMLSPVTSGLQPFRFNALCQDDRSRTNGRPPAMPGRQ